MGRVRIATVSFSFTNPLPSPKQSIFKIYPYAHTLTWGIAISLGFYFPVLWIVVSMFSPSNELSSWALHLKWLPSRSVVCWSPWLQRFLKYTECWTTRAKYLIVLPLGQCKWVSQPTKHLQWFLKKSKVFLQRCWRSCVAQCEHRSKGNFGFGE